MFSSNIPLQTTGGLSDEPSIGHTVYDSGAEALQTLGLAATAIPGVGSPETRTNLTESLSAIHETLNYPHLGLGQRSLDFVANVGTYGIATLPLAYGADVAATGIVGRAALSLSPALPEAILNIARTPINRLVSPRVADYLPAATVGHGVEATVGAYMGYKAAVFPQHLADTYDAKSDRFNLKNAASETLHDNMGFLIAAAPFVSGYLLYKAFKTRASGIAAKKTGQTIASDLTQQRGNRKSTLDNTLKQAKSMRDGIDATEKENLAALHTEVEKGNASPAWAEFYKNYIKDPDSPEVHEQAMAIAKQENIPVNQADGKYWLKMMEPEDINNLKQAYADRLTAGLDTDNKDNMHQFLTKNILDRNREKLNTDPGAKSGLKAYTDYVDKKLAGKDDKLAELDGIVDKSLHRSLRKNEMLSQKSIYNHLKAKGEFHPARIPYTVPRRVAYKLKLRQKLNDLVKEKADPALIAKAKTQLNDFKLLTPVDELRALRKKLITPKNMEKNISHDLDYHRLQDLADIHPNANMLLKRLQEEKEYAKQGAYSNFMKSFLQFVDSSLDQLAKPEHVMNYLRDRIEQESPDKSEVAPDKASASKQKENMKKTKSILENADAMKSFLDVDVPKLEKSQAKEIARELTEEKRKLDQFDENESALDKLINCVEDFLNG